jgi:type IV pilus assembly protein PilY1
MVVSLGMKKVISYKYLFPFVAFLFALFLSQSAFAAQIKLAWDASTETDLAGYKVYYGTSSRTYTNSVDVGDATMYTLTGLTEGKTYYIAVTAYNTLKQESGYSSEVSGVATEPQPPVSETPPTVTPAPSPEPAPTPTITESETSSKETPSETPPSDTGDSGGGGGCTREADAASLAVRYIRNYLYVAVSEVNVGALSLGNIKKYEVSAAQDPSAGVEVGDVFDATYAPALDGNDLIKDSARSYWSTEADGRRVDKGGVGEVLLKRSKPRNLFTYLGESSLTSETNAFKSSNEQLTPEMLGLSAKDMVGRERLIQYVQGFTPSRGSKESVTLKKRSWLLGSVLHSRPLVIPYKGSRSVIYAGANDGMLHAFDDATGEELWGFIPRELLSRLKDLMSGGGLYYVDGSPKAYITESQKIIVFGLRRGGSHYYALDVTDPESPKFLWTIGPEAAEYSEMGQSWSTPQFGRVRFGTGERGVCFIGGGYDENQDRGTVTAEDKRGRAVYVVDVLTGEQVWRWDYGRDPSMRYSIPSEISRVDTNGDGYVDRLYVGDMGGRMWRFDLGSSDTNGWSGRVLFDSSIGVGKRKIFYRPDVTLEKGYQWVLFGTGDREHPSDTGVTNRFYAVKDRGLSTVLTEGDLEDVTSGSSTNDLENKEGWFISLETNRGEKVTGGSVVGYGVLYFTTFSPSLESGKKVARVYALNYRTGNAILNLNPANDTDVIKIDLSDRVKVLGSGIPSGTVMSALHGRLVAYTGFNGGMYNTPLRRHSYIIPVWWKQIF